MVGTGVDGITVVNVTEFPEHFNLLKNLNTEKKYLKEIKKRGTARNSDHYYFYEKGVPAIFIYTLGGKYYHDVFDTGESIPYTAFSNLFYLLTDFVKEIK